MISKRSEQRKRLRIAVADTTPNVFQSENGKKMKHPITHSFSPNYLYSNIFEAVAVRPLTVTSIGTNLGWVTLPVLQTILKIIIKVNENSIC